ncbi:MAG: hypothetical protein GC164_00315 [Phycisphaera sp.]|nr:hypothetical protein [Phycisphaera sp.]
MIACSEGQATAQARPGNIPAGEPLDCGMNKNTNLITVLVIFILAACPIRGFAETERFSMDEVPSQQDILKTLMADHPRLLADEAGFERIRRLVRTDPWAKATFDAERAESDKILAQPVVTYDIPDGKRLLSVSRRVVDHILTLGLVWKVTGERKYLDRAWLDMQAAAGFKDWNPSHFLDTGEMTAALGIGYDWFYHDLSQEQRDTIRQAIITHGLKPGMEVYEGKGWWAKGHNNWNQVCNGGMVMGALAIADEEPGICAAVVHHAVLSLPLAMQSFAPDGGWMEGPGYWGYAMRYNAQAIACLDSALGTDFGLSTLEGFDKAADFYLQMRGATGKSFNYADAHPGNIDHPALFWLAKRFNQPGWAVYQAKYGKPNPMSLVWYDPALANGDEIKLPLVAHFRGVEVASARTGWDDPNALFVGVKAGRNGVPHDHLDLGSFIFEALGKRWLIDLGSDDYNLPGYFGSHRYTYYRLRAEGHNTLVINPGKTQPDQNPKALCLITQATREGNISTITTDLTPAYADHGATTVTRKFQLTDKQLTVTDNVQLDSPGEVWWFYHTPAAVELAPDGRSATLTMQDKRVTARLVGSTDAKFTVMDARPLPGSPDPEGQNPNNGARLLNSPKGLGRVRVGDTPRWGDPDPAHGYRKLAVHLTSVSDAKVQVVFEPIE